MGFIDLAIEERKKVTPKDGFNIVLYDSYAPLGENLTIIKHVDTKEETKKYENNADYFIFESD